MQTEDELYKELGALTKARDKWEESIPYVSSLLNHDSERIQAKALWLLGEMGFANPQAVQNAVPTIASFLNSPAPLLRERSVNAIGRIGRGDYHLIEPYWRELFRFASDEDARVRLSFIWASENIATNTPDIYENEMPVFAKLLYDTDDKVRMEAPEIFRVLGRRRPEFVRPYTEELQRVSETDITIADHGKIPTHLLPLAEATTAVVPDPENGSNTISPGFDPDRIKNSASFSGKRAG